MTLARAYDNAVRQAHSLAANQELYATISEGA